MLVYPKIVTTGNVDSRCSDFHLLVVTGYSGPAMLVKEEFRLASLLHDGDQWLFFLFNYQHFFPFPLLVAKGDNGEECDDKEEDT